jgi:transcriptional regulator of arginine metabolism
MAVPRRADSATWRTRGTAALRGEYCSDSAKNGVAYLCRTIVYLYERGFRFAGRADFLPRNRKAAMKHQRLDAIREVLAKSLVANQDELRRKLRRRGIEVTQATLSRDIHELQLSKGPGGYSLPNGHRGTSAAAEEDDAPPSFEEMIESFGLRAQQAMNQVVVRTVMGGAQPVAAALDREGWTGVVGTVAGDDTVLIICSDTRRAGDVETRLRTMLES